MAAKKTTANDSGTVDILKVQQETIDCLVIGRTPLILNRMSEKAKHELLMPRGRKTASEKATSLKHQPMQEFRASAHTISKGDAPTFLAIPSTAFKSSMATAALDLPGAKKAQIGRLTWVNGDFTFVYGTPQILMSVVRSADMNKTPDIRTRVIVAEWACRLSVTYVKPLIQSQAVLNLLAAAGLTIGVGDYRSEKGKGNYGQFELVAHDDPRFAAIAAQGRATQLAAMEAPSCYDDDTTEMLTWFDTELSNRKLRGVA